jgi:hypothetical protein
VRLWFWVFVKYARGEAAPTLDVSISEEIMNGQHTLIQLHTHFPSFIPIVVLLFSSLPTLSPPPSSTNRRPPIGLAHNLTKRLKLIAFVIDISDFDTSLLPMLEIVCAEWNMGFLRTTAGGAYGCRTGSGWRCGSWFVR